LHVTVTDGRGRPVPPRGLSGWLADAAPARSHGSVNVAFVSDATMRRLNRTYRGVSKTTDVLSFPAGDDGAAVPVDGPLFLGDIVIATGVARRQARVLGHPLTAELRILALHGLLHLLAYDHTSDQGEMGRLEERLRRRADLPAGLIRRGPDRSQPR
jgi:probable rRNA maturation factor